MTAVGPGIPVSSAALPVINEILAREPPLDPITHWDLETDWTLLPDRSGGLYRAELTLLNTRELTVRINCWFGPDLRSGDGPRPHNHPWTSFASWILPSYGNGYTEDRYEVVDGRVHRSPRGSSDPRKASGSLASPSRASLPTSASAPPPIGRLGPDSPALGESFRIETRTSTGRAYRDRMDDREQALRQVAEIYQQGGYVRGPISDRMLRDGWRVYKKGWELRLVLPDECAVFEVRRLLDQAGIRLARSYAKHGRQIQPIYGRDQVLRVLRAAGEDVQGL